MKKKIISWSIIGGLTVSAAVAVPVSILANKKSSNESTSSSSNLFNQRIKEYSFSSLDEKDQESILDAESKAVDYINTFSKVDDYYILRDELNRVQNKIFNEIERKSNLIYESKKVDKKEDINYLNSVEKIKKGFLDERMCSTDENELINFYNEAYIAEERYLDEFSESEIMKQACLNYSIRNDNSYNGQDLKINIFTGLFASMDTFKSLYYEILIYPFLFERVNGRTIQEYEDRNDNILNGTKIDVTITEMYNKWKTIKLVVEKLSFSELSSSTKNSYWFRWFNSINFDSTYNDNGFRLLNEKPNQKVNTSINPNRENKFTDTLLPKNITSQSDIDKYIDNDIKNITKMSRQEILNKTRSVLDRIKYIFNDNEYNKRYNLNKFDTNTSKEIFYNEYNNSLYNKEFKISGDEELLNIRIDLLSLKGAREIYAGVSSEYDVKTEIEIVKYEFLNSMYENLNRKSIFNTIFREVDKFKTLYYELSIFPHLFKALTGKNYEVWLQDGNNRYGEYKEFYLDWLINQYMPYRNFVLHPQKYLFNSGIEGINDFSNTTKQSNWYKWITSTKFDKHYYMLTGLTFEQC